LLVGDFAGHVVGLRDEPVDRRTFHALGLLPEQPEYLIEPPDLLFRLFASLTLDRLNVVHPTAVPI
jgi:hypothetical protein